ncbi:ATP-binding protein [Microbacterium gorillae]|uniref:ATP-binding protein n=1 Tax=Microbacterium gorillae TaxID=1231063 RepID=UPI00058D4D79|nr:ATP-binding protein [Microbacterium gorillae]
MEPETGPALTLPLTGTRSFTRARVERILGVIVGGTCVVFGVQAFLASVGSTEAGRWGATLVMATFAALTVMIITSVTGVLRTTGAALFAAVFPIVLVVWFVVADPALSHPTVQPWTWFLINVATISAALVFPLPWQIVYTVAVPVLYTAVRIALGGGDAVYWVNGLPDMSFSLIFGFVLLIIVWMVRRVSDEVDSARADALATYAEASAAEAREQERMELAALMHDSVLSALLAAARAQVPRERELAVAMARDALTGLADAERDVDGPSTAPMTTVEIASEIGESAAATGVHLVIAPPQTAFIPGRVARAITLAAAQAVANAVQHAAGRGLEVTVTAPGDGCRVVISDSGPGVDLGHVPEDRLGIRASIFARMSAVGGTASLDSRATGTRVTLEWTP